MADSSDTPGVSDRRFVFWLIILGIGIPVLIELATFVRLIYDPFHEAPGANEVERVETGEALFESDADGVTVEGIRARAGQNGWAFELGLRGAPSPNQEIELRVDSLRAGDEMITSEDRTAIWAGGDTTTATLHWPTAEGAVPDRFRAEAIIRDTAADTTRTAVRHVELGHVPVRGQ